MTKEQREEIENFIEQEEDTMTIQQERAIARAILECHDMLEKFLAKAVEIMPTAGASAAVQAKICIAEPNLLDDSKAARKINISVPSVIEAPEIMQRAIRESIRNGESIRNVSSL